MSKAFICETCSKEFKTASGWWKHRQNFPQHVKNDKSKVTPAEIAVAEFLSAGNEGNRRARLKVLVSALRDDEVKEFLLPRVANTVSPYEFMIRKSTTTPYRQEVFCETILWENYEQLLNTLNEYHPCVANNHVIKPKRLTSFIDDRNVPSPESTKSPQEQLSSLIKQVKHENYDKFVEFSTNVASNFNISQSSYQNVLRNNFGKDLEEILGTNIFVPKEDMVNNLNATKSSLKSIYELKFVKSGEICSGYINIKNAIEHLLGKPNMQQSLPCPNDALLIYYYCDAFPWMGWSKFFSGETAIRIKIVEPYNMLSTIITVCSYLGPDDYNHVSSLCQETFKQLSDLKTVTHPLRKRDMSVHIRGMGDGANRRAVTGNSTAMSSYPIEEAPEHRSQLGDMGIFCPIPIKTIEMTDYAVEKYHENLGSKADTKDRRREFARDNLGYTGLQNISMTELSEFYPGMMHRCINATQTICHRIHQIAKITLEDKGQQFEKELSKIARSVNNESDVFKVKFSEAGVYAFIQSSDEILEISGFTGTIKDVLSRFCSGLNEVFPLLMNTPQGLTGTEYERKARIHLGFQFPMIFGYQSVTATIKQVVAYSGFYIDKAIEDAKIIGQPITLKNITDSIMETKHKECKSGNYIYSGGKSGETGKLEYQQRVLEQQFVNEWMKIENKENYNKTSSDAKVMIKLESEDSKNKAYVPFRNDRPQTVPEKEDMEGASSLCLNSNSEDNETKSEDEEVIINPSEFHTYTKSPEEYLLPSKLKSDLHHAAFNNYENYQCTEMSHESAKQYASTLRASGTYSANLNSLDLHIENSQATRINVLTWKRTDKRVSKELFTIKFHMSTNVNGRYFSIEHKYGHQQKQITVSTRKILGLQVNEMGLTLKLEGIPEMYLKDLETKQWKSYSPVDIPSVKNCTITSQFGSNKSLPKYAELFEQDENLKASILAGIRDVYPKCDEKSLADKRPEDLLPVVKDPALVREAQLVVLQLLDDERSNNIRWLISAYLALYDNFKIQLKRRLRQHQSAHETQPSKNTV